MRTRRKQKQALKNAPPPRDPGIFPGLERLQAEEQAERDNYCIETEYRLSDREWARVGQAYLEWLGISQPLREPLRY